MEKLLNKKYPKWKLDQGAELLHDIDTLKKEKVLLYIGKGTIKKGQPVMEIYRGNGITYIGKKLPNGNEEFVTLIKSGEGMGLGISFIE